MNQATGWLSLALFLAIVFSIAFIASDSILYQTPTSGNHEVDIYMKKFQVTQYDAEGLVHFEIAGPFSKHYKKNDTFYIVRPHLIMYTQDRVPWDIHADHGKSLNGNQLLKLWGHVKMLQKGKEPNSDTLILTDDLTFNPQKSFATSDSNVVIKQPGSIIKGRGLRADLTKEIVEIQKQSRGVYEAKEKAKDK